MSTTGSSENERSRIPVHVGISSFDVVSPLPGHTFIADERVNVSTSEESNELPNVDLPFKYRENRAKNGIDYEFQGNVLNKSLAAYLAASNFAANLSNTTSRDVEEVLQPVEDTGARKRRLSSISSVDEKEHAKQDTGSRLLHIFARSSDDRGNVNNGDLPKVFKRHDMKRNEKNQREKERSSRIAHQISELSDLLSVGGVNLPKGTKGSVLAEAALYIRKLQKQQALMEPAELPSHAHMMQSSTIEGSRFRADSMENREDVDRCQLESSAQEGSQSLSFKDYHLVFDCCGVGIGITSMNGTFVDCNQRFCTISGFTKSEILEKTLFNLIAKEDLQRAFDEISNLVITSIHSDAPSGDATSRLILRTSMTISNAYKLIIAIFRDNFSAPKGFSVTLLETFD